MVMPLIMKRTIQPRLIKRNCIYKRNTVVPEIIPIPNYKATVKAHETINDTLYEHVMGLKYNTDKVEKLQKEKLALVMLSNDGYMNYTLPLITSFVATNSWFNGDIVILYDDELLCLSEDNRKKLLSIYPNILFRKVIKKDYDSMIQKYRKTMGSARWQCVFYKYEVFRMTEYDKILLIDSDIIINDSLVDLFDNDCPLGVVQENTRTRDGDKYWNCGVVYFGNNKYRNESTYKDVMNFTLNHGPYTYPEQDALNAYFNGKDKKFLETKYNTSNIINRDIIRKAVILHYWKKPNATRGYERDLFRFYNRLSTVFCGIKGEDEKGMFNKLATHVRLAKEPIDIVIPFVDPTDKNWIEQHNKIFPDTKLDKERYDSNPFFKYVFRGIDKYIPWVNNVYLIVESETQIPEWLDRSKVKIVYHGDFIPKDFLPTYNSICFESFIQKIDGLADYFLYLNDDTYILYNLSKTDLFGFKCKKVSPRLDFYQRTYLPSRIFFREIFNSLSLLRNKLNIKDNKFVCPMHNIKPCIKENFTKTYELCKDEIIKFNTSKKRTFDNLGQIAIMNAFVTDNYMPAILKENSFYHYSKTDENRIKQVFKSDKTICLNEINPKYNNDVTKLFEEKFPNKSKYEK